MLVPRWHQVNILCFPCGLIFLVFVSAPEVCIKFINLVYYCESKKKGKIGISKHSEKKYRQISWEQKKAKFIKAYSPTRMKHQSP